MTGRRRRNPNSWTRKFKTQKSEKQKDSTCQFWPFFFNILKRSLYISIPLFTLFSTFYSFVYIVENTDVISRASWIEKVADFRMSQENYHTAFGLWTRIHEINRREFGSSHERTINTLSQLGSISVLQNRRDEALHFFMKVYEKRQTTLGEDHPETRKALEQMVHVQADHLVEQGLWKKPDSHSEALASLDKTFVPEPGSEPGKMEDEKVGNIMIERMFKQALASSKSAFGELNPQATNYTNALALHLHEKGRTEEALSLLQTTYKKHCSLHAAAHPETLFILVGLVDILLSVGRIAEAEKLALGNFAKQQRQAQEPQQEKNPAQIKKLRITALQSVGQSYFKEKKYVEAEKVFEKVYNFHLVFLGQGHEWTLESLTELLNSITLQKRFNKEKALGLYKTFLTTSQESLLNIKPDGEQGADENVNRLTHLASISNTLEDYETSLKYSSQLFKVLEKTAETQLHKYKLMAFALDLIGFAQFKLGHLTEMIETSKKIDQWHLENREKIPKNFRRDKPTTR